MCTDQNASECNYIDLQTIRAMKHEQHMQVWEVLGSLLSRKKKMVAWSKARSRRRVNRILIQALFVI